VDLREGFGAYCIHFFWFIPPTEISELHAVQISSSQPPQGGRKASHQMEKQQCFHMMWEWRQHQGGGQIASCHIFVENSLKKKDQGVQKRVEVFILQANSNYALFLLYSRSRISDLPVTHWKNMFILRAACKMTPSVPPPGIHALV
jgi:hypothetical protein